MIRARRRAHRRDHEPAGPEHDDHEHGRGRRAGGDADDVGTASGLRGEDWKIAPENPNEAPTSTAVSARGSRSWWMMKSEDSLPWPKIAGTTSLSGIGKSPTEIETQNTTKVSRGENERDGDRPGPTGGAGSPHDQSMLVEGQPSIVRRKRAGSCHAIRAPPACGGARGRRRTARRSAR